MIHLFIGIDPSINSTGICIQAFKYIDESNYEKLYTKFYVVHGGKLRKKDLEAEQQFAKIFQFVNYDKREFKEFKGIDNNKFELAKTHNLISIVNCIKEIISKETLKLKNECDEVFKYITIESNSFNSRSSSVSLIELCGLNFLIRNAFFNKDNTELIIGTPAEIKKFATSKGNADKELMSLIFKLYFPDLVNSCLKTDDIADAFFMSNFSKSKTLDIKDEIEEKYDIAKISKDVQKSKKEEKKLTKRSKYKNLELDELLESI